MATDLVNVLQAPCSGAKLCPISATPCPGECIYADIMASVSLGIVVFDLARRSVVFCNHWAGDLFARASVPVAFEPLRAALLHGESGAESGSVVQPPPLRLGTRFVGFTVYYAREFAWVFVRDITEKLRLEAIAEAVETTNNIGYVFSAVRHELGNPINSIKVALGVLGANLDTFSRDAIGEYVERMTSEIGRVERLLRSLRSFSLYERPETAAVDMDHFLADLLRLVGPELASRGIRLVAPPATTAVAHCDARALHHVVLNLVTNASDAVAGCPDPTISVRCASSDTLVTLCVEDNGCGVAPEQRAHLFKPFNTTKESGTGLGLVIARKLLAAMSGTIALDGGEAGGTVATVTLPVAPARRAAAGALS